MGCEHVVFVCFVSGARRRQVGRGVRDAQEAGAERGGHARFCSRLAREAGFYVWICVCVCGLCCVFLCILGPVAMAAAKELYSDSTLTKTMTMTLRDPCA